jgi:hypothetical protein
MALVAVALSLAACTPTAPPSFPHNHKATVPPRAAALTYAVPAVQPGELARILYTKPGSLDGATVDIPAGGHGYNLDFGCRADDPSQKIGFELVHGTTMIVAGTGHCDGNDYSDTALPPGSPAESVHLVFTGVGPTISAAYLILAPSEPS